MTDIEKRSYEEAIEEFIREVFEQNYELLRLETGMAIAPDIKQTALNQVLLYWRVLRDVAENVTDTEVRLSLPQQKTPHKRNYNIEGVVDIVRDSDQTIMYDIKTHDADYVRANIDLYEQQLNIYAYIWQELRQQPLDQTAVIATNYPEEVQVALESGNNEQLAWALSRWDPVVPIEFSMQRVLETIHEFGEVVDAIEENVFAPPPVETLQGALPGSGNVKFATRVCRNCDARFSCDSYRRYARQGRGQVEQRDFKQYYRDLTAGEEDESWRTASLDAAYSTEDLRRDFVE